MKSKSVSRSVMSNSLWPHGCSPPGSSVHGILQARILEWFSISFSRRFSWSRDWTQFSCIAGRFFTIWVIWEAPFSSLSGCRVTHNGLLRPWVVPWNSELICFCNYPCIHWEHSTLKLTSNSLDIFTVFPLEFRRSVVSDSATPRTAARQTSLSITNLVYFCLYWDV